MPEQAKLLFGPTPRDRSGPMLEVPCEKIVSVADGRDREHSHPFGKREALRGHRWIARSDFANDDIGDAAR